MSNNETKKTGIFWGVAGVTTLLAAIVAWPTSQTDDENLDNLINNLLFAKFTDPLAAGNMEIVTFNDEQGTLENFEVKRDEKTGLWTIPSRGGYPADALDQMREAANAFVDLKVLDVPSINAEDHEGFGVLEPDADKLSIGDEGVGRLVSFRDAKSTDLATLIIGKKVPNQDGQVYVRIPNQDPVYVVKLDDSPLTTKFEDWIEEDLLQLSSIDIQNLEVKDYNAGITLQGRISLDRNYTASFDMEGTQWTIDSLEEFDDDPLSEAKPVEIDPIKTVNSTKLNEMKNALDDLKFVNVLRKPEGISADLKADKDFTSDSDARRQLISKGFYPVQLGVDGPTEILSANGELNATLKSGVKYILRFGNIAGVAQGDDSADEDEESKDAENSEEKEESSGGVNRYLMVSTVVDQSMFPAPELEKIPGSIEELEAMEAAEKAEEEAKESVDAAEPSVLNAPVQDQPEMKEEEKSVEPEKEETTADDPDAEDKKDGDSETKSDKKADEGKTEETKADEEKADEEKAVDPKDAEKEDSAEDSAKKDEPVDNPETDDSADPEKEADAGDDNNTEAEGETAESGETEVEGSDEATVVGEGQEADDSKDDTSTESESESGDETADAKEGDDEKDQAAEKSAEQDSKEAAEPVETEDEKKERLAAVQERITKENERKIDERNEKLEEAKRKSRELNQRFADWYYVIPEATYSKLRIDRDEIFQSESDAAAPPTGGFSPNFGGPGQQFNPPQGFGN